MRSPEKYLRPHIRDLTPYASARDEFSGQANIWLDANENPFDNGVNRYPDPTQQELKKRIAPIFGVSENQLFLGNGSDEAIDLLIRIFCQPEEDAILICPPTYGMYKVSAASQGVATKELLLDENFLPQLDDVDRDHFSNCKMLFLCSPNNPTGNSIPTDMLRQVLEIFEGIVVVDEAYGDFSQAPSAIELIKKYPNLVVLRTFSKAWGMAGIRLGMGIANPPIIGWLNKVKAPYNINQLTIDFTLKKLKELEGAPQNVDSLRKERNRLKRSLLEIDIVKKVFRSEANFLLVKFANAREVYRALLGEGIVVRDRSNQPQLENCLRITVGTPSENDQLIKKLKALS